MHNESLPVNVGVRNLCYSVSNQNILKRCFKAQVELLHNVDFLAVSGNVTVILGPSGCGKTTFLNVLGNRAVGKISGCITFNGRSCSSRQLRSFTALLHANDKLLPYLSVRETLMFTAYLRLPDRTSAERRVRVEEVIEQLGLKDVADTMIGGSWRKGCSSGEIRRVSIGMELLGNPTVFLLDEPTSGLDAILAIEVGQILKSLAQSGMTIITTLHQPRSGLTRLFNNVAVMCDGKIMWQGSIPDAKEHFSSTLSCDITLNGNYADDLLDIASNVNPSPQEGITSSKFAVHAYSNSEYHSRIITEITDMNNNPTNVIDKRPQINPIIRYIMQIYGVAFRTFLNQWKNPSALLVTVLVQLGMGIFLGCLFFRLPQKYLPEHKPMDIRDPNSPAMQMLNNPLFNFMAYGTDGNGTNPIVNLITDGVDGNGSDPIEALLKGNVPRRLANMMPCAHKRLGLDKLSQYAQTNFSEYNERWGAKPGPSNGLIAGEYSVPNVLTQIMQSLQFADYMFYELPWRKLHNVCKGKFAYASCFGCYGPAGSFLDAASECVDIPQQPINPLQSCEESLETPINPFEDGTASRVLAFEDQLHDKVADSGKRLLQISGLMGNQNINLASFLPKEVVGLVNAAGEYKDALHECQHPICRSVEEKLTAGVFKSDVANYVAVMAAALNIAGAMFFCATAVCFTAYEALTAICSERPLINRELANGTYKPSSYFIGRSLGDLLFQVISTFLLVTVFFLLIDVEKGPNWLWFIRYIFMCLLIASTAYSFSYFISAMTPSMEVAVVAAPLTLVVLTCCSGFFVRDSAIPASMTWLKYMSYVRWGFFLLVSNQFPESERFFGIPNSFILAVVGVSETSLKNNCLALLGISLGLRLCAYISLKFLNRNIGVEC